MKALYQTFAVGLGLVPLAWIGSFSRGMLTLISPMPTLIVIPAFFLASPPSHLPYRLAILVPALLYFAWTPCLFRGDSQVPKRSWVLLARLSLLSVAYFVSSWGYGNQYQGHGYTFAICAVNILWLLGLWTSLYRSSRVCSFRANLFFHGALFAWLAWYAFPYLGELP